MRKNLLLQSLVALLMTSFPALAQDDLPGIFGEVLDVRVVNLEVVVTNRSGQRMTGLGPESFRLLVDGKEVPIEYFSEVAEGAVASRARNTGEPAGVPSLASGKPVGTSYLVFIDDFFSIGRDRNKVLDSLSRDLPRLWEEDRMAIVAYDGRDLEMLSSWSNSVPALERAFKEAQRRDAYGLHRVAERRSLVTTRGLSSYENLYRDVGYRLTPEELDYATRLEEQIKSTVGAASSTIRSFAMPPGRKVMILLSGGWPFDPAQLGSDAEVVLNTDVTRGAGLFMPLIDTANLLGYTIYPVDVPGLRGNTAGADQAEPQNLGFAPETEVEAGMMVMARETGGRALLNSLNLNPLETVWEDTRSYYWIGYSPTRSRDDRSHKIKIEVREKGLRVRSRKSFLDLSRSEEVSAMVESTLLFGNAPSGGDLPLEVGEIEKKGGRRMEVPLTLAIPVSAVTFLPTSEGYATQLEVRFAVRDDGGGQAPMSVVPLRFDGPNEPDQDGFLRYETSLTLRRRPHEVVVSVFDPASGRMISNRLEIDKP